MDFIKLIGGIMILFVFVAGGLWIVADNITVGNIEETEDLQNQTTSLTLIRDTLNTTYTSQREEYEDMVEGEIAETNALDFMIGNGFKAIQNIIRTFKVMGEVVNDIAILMHIPAFIVNAIVVFILAAVVMTFIYMMFRFQPK